MILAPANTLWVSDALGVAVVAGDDATRLCRAPCPGQIPGYRPCGRHAGHAGRHEAHWHDNYILTWEGDTYPVKDAVGPPQVDRTFVAPREWAQYDKQCETCDGGKLRWALVGTPFRCPDCRDGRQVWELRTECSVCLGRDPMTTLDLTYCPNCDCRSGSVPLGRFTVQVVPVPTEAEMESWLERPMEEPPPHIALSDTCAGDVGAFLVLSDDEDYPLGALDPLPVPGQDFAVVFRRVSDDR